MKKILIIEDDLTASKYIESIDEEKYEIYLSKNLTDADYRIKVDPGIENISAIIVDLCIDIPFKEYQFDKDDEEYLKKFENKTITGWVWIRKFLNTYKNYPTKNIAIVSAYTDQIPSNDMRLYHKDITFIDKAEKKPIEKINSFLQELQD